MYPRASTPPRKIARSGIGLPARSGIGVPVRSGTCLYCYVRMIVQPLAVVDFVSVWPHHLSGALLDVVDELSLVDPAVRPLELPLPLY